MSKFKKGFLILMILLNTMVLLGQVWPEGAPPFARTVNIITVVLNLILVLNLLMKRKFS